MDQGPQPVDDLAGGGFLLDLGHLPDAVEGLQGLGEQILLQVREVDPDDLRHQLLVRELDVVEHAPAQEGVGQLLLRVGGDDDHRPVSGGDRLPRLRDVELHPVQLPQQVVGELQIRLVDLVNEQDHLLLRGERLPQLPQPDVLGDVVHPLAPELAVVQALNHVVHIQPVLGLGGGLDVPDNQFLAQGLGDGLGQHGLAGARLPLDEQGLLEHHGDVHRPHQLLRGHIVLTSAKLAHIPFLSGAPRPHPYQNNRCHFTQFPHKMQEFCAKCGLFGHFGKNSRSARVYALLPFFCSVFKSAAYRSGPLYGPS